MLLGQFVVLILLSSVNAGSDDICGCFGWYRFYSFVEIDCDSKKKIQIIWKWLQYTHKH